MKTKLFPVHVLREGDGRYVAWPATLLMPCSVGETEEEAVDLIRCHLALYHAQCAAAGKEVELTPADKPPLGATLRWVAVAL